METGAGRRGPSRAPCSRARPRSRAWRPGGSSLRVSWRRTGLGRVYILPAAGTRSDLVMETERYSLANPQLAHFHTLLSVRSALLDTNEQNHARQHAGNCGILLKSTKTNAEIHSRLSVTLPRATAVLSARSPTDQLAGAVCHGED